MSTVVEGVRTRRRATAPEPSVREVCVLGLRRPAKGWTAGAQVVVSGRVYRVEATRACAGDDAAARYVHLAPGGARGTG
jgi:hypothetical protein